MMSRPAGADPPAADTRLSDADVGKVLELLKGATAVELKLVVDHPPGATLRRLGFDPVEAQPRQVYFFDTPDLALERAGLIVRARRSAGDRGDTVVKLRPIDPHSIDAALGRDEALKIELDAMPGGYVCSASFKGRCSGEEVLQAGDGARPLKSIFSSAQRAAYRAYAPDDVAPENLRPLGPTFLLRVKRQPKKFDRPVVVELWLYPDSSTVLEISTKGAPAEAFQLAAHFRGFLAECGIPVEAAAGSKTATALRYFSRQVQGQPGRPGDLQNQVPTLSDQTHPVPPTT